MIKKFLLAASYVTSLPFLHRPESEDELSGLSRYLPAVGLMIGAFLSSGYLFCRILHADSFCSALLITLAWLLITGSIHLDGLMDAADGLFSHRERERMLEIMRDSRVGNFGAISGFTLILTKFVCLASLPALWMLPVLFLLPSWARWVEVFAIVSYPYARQEGMGKVWHESSSTYDLLVAAALPGLAVMLVCLFSHSFMFSLLIPVVVLPGICFAHKVNGILSGHTGDTYGATVEFSEAAALLLLCLLQKAIQA